MMTVHKNLNDSLAREVFSDISIAVNSVVIRELRPLMLFIVLS